MTSIIISSFGIGVAMFGFVNLCSTIIGKLSGYKAQIRYILFLLLCALFLLMVGNNAGCYLGAVLLVICAIGVMDLLIYDSIHYIRD